MLDKSSILRLYSIILSVSSRSNRNGTDFMFKDLINADAVKLPW